MWVSVCLSYVLVCKFILHSILICHHPPICSDSPHCHSSCWIVAEWCFKLRRCIDNRRLFALKAGSTDDLLVHALLTILSAVPSGVCQEKWKGPLDGERQPVQPEYTHAGLEWSICLLRVLRLYSLFLFFRTAWRMVMEAEAVFAERCARDRFAALQKGAAKPHHWAALTKCDLDDMLEVDFLLNSFFCALWHAWRLRLAWQAQCSSVSMLFWTAAFCNFVAGATFCDAAKVVFGWIAEAGLRKHDAASNVVAGATMCERLEKKRKLGKSHFLSCVKTTL